MTGMLLAYDADGQVVATLDWLVIRDDDGIPVGLADFAAHEAAGGENLEIWQVSHATGSKFWPENLGGRAHEYRVELSGPPGQKRISALVHNETGQRRGRGDAERASAPRTEEDGRDQEPRRLSRTLPLIGALLAVGLVLMGATPNDVGTACPTPRPTPAVVGVPPRPTPVVPTPSLPPTDSG